MHKVVHLKYKKKVSVDSEPSCVFNKCLTIALKVIGLYFNRKQFHPPILNYILFLTLYILCHQQLSKQPNPRRILSAQVGKTLFTCVVYTSVPNMFLFVIRYSVGNWLRVY